ncbi:MAG: aldolase/citrate lyase family protein [Pseudomonadota bacterium]
MNTSFRKKLLAGEPLIGTWVKTPSHIVSEVLGHSALDCISLDAEHAPFDRGALDASIAALRAASMASLVRIPHTAPEHVLNALDCGATGIIAPHLKSAEEANALAQMSRYGAGGRGYAGSSRSAGYGTSGMADNLERGNKNSAVIAQIEDLEALDEIDDIAKVDGIDCFFIGRIDLTVALGATSPKDPIVVDAVKRVCTVCRDAGRAVGMFVGDLAEIPKWRQAGATLFILKSDHSFLLDGARQLRDDFDQQVRSTS